MPEQPARRRPGRPRIRYATREIGLPRDVVDQIEAGRHASGRTFTAEVVAQLRLVQARTTTTTARS
jgi:hypothetical protein